MIRTLLHQLSTRFPVQRIFDASGASLYLERFMLLDLGPHVGRLVLHRFARSDAARELHNHPWYGVALILWGGYREERRVWNPTGGGLESVRVRHLRPGNLNFLAPHTFHRADLTVHESWSLFLTGPIVQSWGFWCRDTGRYTPWREFVAAGGRGA